MTRTKRVILFGLGAGTVGFFLSLLPGCSHFTAQQKSSFEACIRDYAYGQADAKVQAAVSCGGERTCLIRNSMDDFASFVSATESCAKEDLMTPADAGASH